MQVSLAVPLSMYRFGCNREYRGTMGRGGRYTSNTGQDPTGQAKWNMGSVVRVAQRGYTVHPGFLMVRISRVTKFGLCILRVPYPKPTS